MNHSKDLDTSLPTPVKIRKDMALKVRLQSFIKALGMSEPEFFHKLEISRQRWYYYSWGLWITPDHLKIRISNALNIPISSIWPEKEEEEKRDGN